MIVDCREGFAKFTCLPSPFIMKTLITVVVQLVLIGILVMSEIVVAHAATNIVKADVYRIPAAIQAKNGDILAFAEGRKSGIADAGNIDLLLKRSSDGGRSWSAQQVIWDDTDNTCGNPCPVLDEDTGTIWLLLTHNLGADHEKDIIAQSARGTRTVWITSSTDHGATWTTPFEITSTTKKSDWTWSATGPGIGIQIKNGPHTGRLVIPCDHIDTDPADPKKARMGSHAIFSDDHGKTWQLGGTITPAMNECQVTELFDGRGTLLMDMRSYFGRSLRAQSLSTDGGATWSASVDAPALFEPICQASLLRHDAAKLILFSNPAHPKRRVNLTVRSSADNAKTWSDVAVLHAGPAAYSSLVPLDAKTAGCLYENGEANPYERITFARFPLRP